MVPECSPPISKTFRCDRLSCSYTSTLNSGCKEYTKRPRTDNIEARKYHPQHVAHPCSLSLQECLALSDVVVSAVPSAEYKVKTEWLKDGCVCLNVAADKNFEKDVREKVRIVQSTPNNCWWTPLLQASLYLPTIGKVTITILLRNL